MADGLMIRLGILTQQFIEVDQKTQKAAISRSGADSDLSPAAAHRPWLEPD